MQFQRTIQNAAVCKGTGLHTGNPVTMRIKPAPASTGIVFIRTDLEGREIAAMAVNAADANYATSLGRNGAAVKTVEHLLAALAGLDVDNAIVELDAEEVPIMDGSAGPFFRLIANAGIQPQETPRKMIKVIEPLFVSDGSKQIGLWPADSTSISCCIEFDHPMIREQSLQYMPSKDSFRRELADARTFGFLSDVESLQANGLAKGASLANAIGLTADSVLNPEGLRYRDEFVRHKVLDLIGDLSLAGAPIIGQVVAHKAGHALNLRMVNKLLGNPEAWVLIDAPAEKENKHQELPYQHAMVV